MDKKIITITLIGKKINNQILCYLYKIINNDINQFNDLHELIKGKSLFDETRVE